MDGESGEAADARPAVFVVVQGWHTWSVIKISRNLKFLHRPRRLCIRQCLPWCLFVCPSVDRITQKVFNDFCETLYDCWLLLCKGRTKFWSYHTKGQSF